MLRTFKIEKHHTDIVSKSTLFKALKYLDRKKIETPFLLIDREKVKEKASLIGQNIRNSKVFYAVKANPDIEVIKLADKLGMGFEIASEGELKLLSSIGVKPERIITSNPVKTFKFLKAAASYGLNYFAYDSEEEVNKMAGLLPGCSVYVRLSVPNEGSEWPLNKKFGVEINQAAELLSYAGEKGLRPVGITFHVGSQCTNIYNWNSALDKAKVLWDIAEKKGIKLNLLNIGGGYPIKYTKNVVDVDAIEKNVDRLIREKFQRDVKVFIEPGRAVIGDAGIFVASVIGKTNRGDDNWLHIDVGVFSGLMESIGGITYSYIIEASRQARHKRKWILAGPSCDSFDVIDKNVNLPEPEIGGLMLILSSGAYTISYASKFNGFSIPKTVLI
ncbi:MAG: type III PLP-dependent enzyme [Nitrospirae bacterium CG02_land_8_20_14_3_00_44_33]|nr:type III PLP-dependent enzyme [Nitrospirota bacterium]OIO32047.1 MAG: ornithine decarboxylase [Nitrospirae bacterium CG1_02_44_142]PIV41721.1 MAG: type III PLP-dependent enzyme [Nitrospirae bacterium CG02_land_8_20_14_3_00_44_33]PIV65405.1 MAG: type III PLP-dependent enzyme [Nitrospirae bacterium CG01_land_8_20_14_3_00_44_22]PJA81416.1 MAG: type III PLP-dependent enzyme [Nitrospirae bacterium CG_4_9_14_3_um_filter_44_28]